MHIQTMRTQSNSGVLRGDEAKRVLLDIAFISSTVKCVVGYNALRCRPCSKGFDAM